MQLISQKASKSLILAGGGARLSYQAGVILALQEEGIAFSHVDGTSGGIFNTAMLASGIEPAEMTKRWRKVNVMHFSSLLPFRDYFSKKTFTAFGSAKGMIDKVYPTLGIDVTRINTNTTIDATFNVCNFSKKSIEVLTNQNVTLQHLVAGMSLPIFMPAIKIDGDWYTDAVWIKDANLNEAMKRNVEEIWLVWAIGNSHEFVNGAFNQYVHMIEISAGGGLLIELEQLEKQNAASGRKTILHVIKPEFPLPLDPDLMLNRINIDELINLGYADAKDYLKRRMPAGVAPDYKASSMKEPGVCFTFRIGLSGKIMWQSDPADLSVWLQLQFRMISGELVLRAFGSLAFDDGDRISTFNNHLRLRPSEKILAYDGEFKFENQTYYLQCEFDLISPIDLQLGLEFKRARCTITGKNLPRLLKFQLRQTIKDRIRNLPFMHISSNSSWIGKWKERNKILNKVYQ
jgi:predicted acylesterase/phospholipase RssA